MQHIVLFASTAILIVSFLILRILLQICIFNSTFISHASYCLDNNIVNRIMSDMAIL